ncbi:MAG: hypothetical protein U0271_05495 [Polyangiaceae bacterium]
MMKRNSLLQVGALLLGLTVGGCESKTVTPIERNDSNADEVVTPSGPANPEDAYSCALVVEEPITPAYGQLFGCTTREAECTGWGGAGHCDLETCDVGPFYAYCGSYHCDSDADCPVPLSGDVAPSCLHQFCQLACDPLEDQCPDGFGCFSTADWGWSDPSSGRVPAPFMCMQRFDVEMVPGNP